MGQKAPNSPNTSAKSGTSVSEVSFVSPAKAAELQMKNYEQLHYLQGLLDDGIIIEKELVEQKQSVLDALRRLS